MRNKEREICANMVSRRIKSLPREWPEVREHGMPTTAIVLGTGWGDALNLETLWSVPLVWLHGFESLEQLEGHKRELIFARLNGKSVWVLSGRIHANENPIDLNLPKMVRLQTEMLLQLGVKNLILTNAAGSLSGDIKVGDIVVADGFVTLFAPKMPLWGGEFCSPEDTLDKDFRQLALKSAEGLIDAHQGGYAMVQGPFFEGRKYDKAILRMVGASTVGMSTLPESCIAALYREEGVKVLALSFITNTDSEDHSHEENVKRVNASSSKLGELISRIVAKI
ncbi:MAG: purine-nucleoside phosphorylase [Candidatus Vogelbacteria bacterium]|nr:purine-nucleoside phosphorylase [Candidatus Vogelbacteria bacterium]